MSDRFDERFSDRKTRGSRHWLRIWEGTRQAGQVIQGHKMRSLLLIVGVAIGVATLLAIFTIVTGLSGKIRDDVVSANRPYMWVARYTGLGGEDIEAKLRRRQLLPECLGVIEALESVSAVDYYVQNNNDATVLHYGEERTHFVQVFGSTETFPLLFSFTMDEGRYFTRAEVTARAPVCVLGHGPRADLFPKLDPIGKWLRIRGHSYEVIGTIEPRKHFIGQLGDNFVAIPWTTYEKDHLDPDVEDRSLAASIAEGFSADEVEADLTGVLRQLRRLDPGEPNDFDIVASETYGDLIDRVTHGVALILVVLSSIGLMVGGIGVMNIMLISVTERTREIGVRRATGARRQDVLFQVLVEAGTLTGIGGVIGIGLGYLLSWFVTGLLEFPFEFSPIITLAAVLFSVAIGLIFGLYPADRAARLDPIEALRRE
jgi:putative ABC transport system permease protein